jgi:HSP20 family protein
MDTRDLLPQNWFKRRREPVSKEGTLWSGLERDMEKVFEDFGKDFGNFESFLPRLFRTDANTKILPRVDISETEKEYTVEADLPGVKKEDLDMSISKDGVLIIKGKRESKEEHKDRNYYRIERSFGSFERSLILPENCDLDNVDATFRDGTLTLKMPKKELAEGEIRKIKLSSK